MKGSFFPSSATWTTPSLKLKLLTKISFGFVLIRKEHFSSRPQIRLLKIEETTHVTREKFDIELRKVSRNLKNKRVDAGI